MKLNEKGKELWRVWLCKWAEEIDDAKIGEETGTCIFENEKHIKNITDECGYLLLTYPYTKGYAEYDAAFKLIVGDWKWSDKEYRNELCWDWCDFTYGDVVEELKKYLIIDVDDNDYEFCEKYEIEPW